MRQRIKFVANHYEVFNDKSSQNLIAFAKQKKMKIREEITFYTSTDQTKLYFSSKADKTLDFKARNTIRDEAGIAIGSIKNEFGKSLLRTTWIISDNSGNQIVKLQERSANFAILRRLWDFIPILGEFPIFGRIQFDYLDNVGKVVGTNNRRWSLRDEYDIEFTDEAVKILDERLAIASFVMLDAFLNR